MRCHHIEARDLPDAWFSVIDTILEHGRVWLVEHGSYEGMRRWELDYVTVHVKYPGTRPLLPEIPKDLGIPDPVAPDYLDQYMPYMLTTHKEPNETYTYGERLVPQMEKAIERYKRNGFGSNQECISIARPEDFGTVDPPCLRSLDTRVYASEYLRDGEEQALHFFPYFRSWDAFNGFPANLAAIRLVQEYMAGEIGVAAGEIIASSKGLHIYEHAWSLAKIRTAR